MPSRGSHKMAVCKCNVCGRVFERTFKEYFRKNRAGEVRETTCGDVSCVVNTRESTMVEKYGEPNAGKIQQFRERIEATNLEKYGHTVSSKNDDVKEKAKKTIIEKYGVEHHTQLAEVQQKKIETNLEKYGHEQAAQSEAVKQTVIKKNIEKYGVEHTATLESVKDKIKKTNLEKYGHVCPLLSDVVKAKKNATNLVKYGSQSPFGNKDIFQKGIDTIIHRYGTVNKFNISKKAGNTTEQDVINWVNSLGFSLKETRLMSDTKVYDGVDFENKIAVEYNGLFWHAEDSKTPRGRSYHYEKFKKCKANGIRLFSIFSDEWINREQQVKSFIRAALNKCEHRFFARKMSVEVISKEDADSFYEKYHIQGGCPSNIISCALKQGEEIIGCMSFGRHHRKVETVVLTRLCFKDNCYVVGGSSKMFKFLLNDTQSTEVISWSDNRWSNGDVYRALGFYLDAELPPDYFYINMKQPTGKISKQSQKKSRTSCPDNKTELEFAKENGLSRVWDCGKIRWKWVKHK